MKDKQLVIGLGEIGTAMKNVLGCDGYDKYKGVNGVNTDAYGVIHICFPYSDEFVDQVKAYQEEFAPALTIVHSTVPVGTCDKLEAVHNPVRGVHPHLEEGIRTFVNFFGGPQATIAAGLFQEKGIRTVCTDDAREVEALKLWDTTMYGWNILFQKAMKAYCDKHGLDFRLVYTLSGVTYNEGYEKLGHPEFAKYVLKDFPGPIGGHCVQENWELLDDPIVEISKNLHKQLTDL